VASVAEQTKTIDELLLLTTLPDRPSNPRETLFKDIKLSSTLRKITLSAPKNTEANLNTPYTKLPYSTAAATDRTNPTKSMDPHAWMIMNQRSCTYAVY